MNIDLKDKVILLTGASRGIGRAIAKALSDANAVVAAHYNANSKHAESLPSELNDKSALFQADLSIAKESIDLVDAVFKKFGRIDVVINNAGIAISTDMRDNDDKWLEEWNKTLNVNLQAVALICKKTIPLFHDQGGGIIINVSSRAAHRGDTPDYLAYAASKGGVVALTKSLARGYGKQNIVAYSVAPGFTKTDMAQDFIDAYGEDYATSDLSLSELTTPEDIAPTIVFLASGLAKHATGTTIDINAGSYVR